MRCQKDLFSHEAQVSTFGYVLRIQSPGFNPAQQGMQQGEWKNFPEQPAKAAVESDIGFRSRWTITATLSIIFSQAGLKRLRTVDPRKASTWQLWSKTITLPSAILLDKGHLKFFLRTLLSSGEDVPPGSVRYVAYTTHSENTEWFRSVVKTW